MAKNAIAVILAGVNGEALPLQVVVYTTWLALLRKYCEDYTSNRITWEIIGMSAFIMFSLFAFVCFDV